MLAKIGLVLAVIGLAGLGLHYSGAVELPEILANPVVSGVVAGAGLVLYFATRRARD